MRAGREPDSELLLDDPRVSARHALLRWDGSDWSLVDEGSKNGTFVNGTRADGSPLVDGDWISFGGLLGRFELLSEEQIRALEKERDSRLQTSVELQRRIAAERDPAGVLRRLLGSVLEVVGAERGFVLLLGPEGRLQARVASGFATTDVLDERFDGSFGAIRHVLETGQPIVASDALADALLSKRPSVVSMGIGALACVPLRGEGGPPMGLMYVDGRKQGGRFTDLDIQILEALANHASLVVAGMRIDHQIRELLGSSDHRGRPEEAGFLEELGRRVEQIVHRPGEGTLPVAPGGR